MFLIDYLPDTSMASISNSPVLITAWSRLEEGEEKPVQWNRFLYGAYQGDGFGGQVHNFDLVVVGVCDVEKPAAAAGTDSSRLVEAGQVKIRAKSVSGLTSAGQRAALFGLWIHYLDLKRITQNTSNYYFITYIFHTKSTNKLYI